MMKQLKKVLSILCAIALLISSITFALAEETDPAEQQAQQNAAEEAAQAEAEAAEKAAEEEAAAKEAEEEAARKAAEEEAARKAAEEEAARKAAEEEAARKAAEEEAAAKEAEEEAARKAAEEEAARKAAEEEAARKAAEEEAAEKAAEEEAQKEEEPSDEEETSYYTEEEAEEEADEDEDEDEGDDDLVQLDDDYTGYMAEEYKEEMTDEMKGLRKAEMSIGQVLSDTLGFDEELTIVLKACDASTIELRLLIPAGAAINTKVNGKDVSFTPADSDVASMNLYTYELANAAGRSHEIVLTSYDDVPFELSAVVKQNVGSLEPMIQEEPIPGTEEEKPEQPVEETAEEEEETEVVETPVPTIQASVKTYNALKIGGSIKDTLVAGQKARIQVKCGKNPYVTLTLNADPDDVNVTIDGASVQFTDAGNGTYTCDLDDVAFRKFTVMIAAKQDLAFSLSASGHQAEETPAAEEEEEEEEETEEEPAEEIKEEETTEESTEEPAEEATEEETEETSEETEETETPEEGEEAEGGEDSKEEKEEFKLPEDSSVSFTISWNDGKARLGAVAHFKATIIGYEGIDYTIQWQQSSDNQDWQDIEGANEDSMDVLATEETNKLFYRVIVIVKVPEEATEAEETPEEVSETSEE